MKIDVTQILQVLIATGAIAGIVYGLFKHFAKENIEKDKQLKRLGDRFEDYKDGRRKEAIETLKDEFRELKTEFKKLTAQVASLERGEQDLQKRLAEGITKISKNFMNRLEAIEGGLDIDNSKMIKLGNDIYLLTRKK